MVSSKVVGSQSMGQIWLDTYFLLFFHFIYVIDGQTAFILQCVYVWQKWVGVGKASHIYSLAFSRMPLFQKKDLHWENTVKDFS